MLQKELWYKRKAPVFGARHCALKRMRKVPAKKKKKSRERKGQNKIHGKSAQVSFPPFFSNGNTATIGRRKKKKTL